MNKKKILLICIIICCIFSLQAVAAADGENATDDTVLTSSNVSAYSLPNFDDTLQDGSANAGTFSDLQSDISGGGSITLERNYTYDSSSDPSLVGGLNLSDGMTIEGNGKVIIDANNLARVFKVPKGATVTLKGITFINANPASGPGGSIFATGTVHIDNCKFINNTANKANGGAVSLTGFGSTITNSYFEGNKAIMAPNTEYKTGIGGSVFLNASNITVSHSKFVKNMAGLNGGGIGSSAMKIQNCTITNCTFNSNKANGSAGGVGMQSSNFHIYNSTFKDNEAKGLFTIHPGNGGGLVMRGWDSYAYNCTFINNTAAKHGGAAFLTNTSYNSSNNNTGFKLSTFINNTAGSNGGAVDWAAGATYGYIDDCTFTNNTAKRSGGAVHWSGHNGRISNSTFTNNKATGEVTSIIGGILGGGDGGAVVWVGSHGVINNNCIFTNNYAKYRGGAIFLHGNSTENCTNVSVDKCTFRDNIAGLNGGAIDWQKGSHDGMLTNSIFTNNTAWRSGGAVYWNGINGTIKYCDFTDNHAIGNVTNHDQNIANYTTDGGNGGAVIWTGPQGTVYKSNFTNNSAKIKGGAVYLQGISGYPCNNTKFDTCRFISNVAGVNGGAIDWYQGAMNGNVVNSLFENNTANRSGGAIFWSGVNGTIKNSNFTNNKALGITEYNDTYGNLTYGGYGGAVMWTGSNGFVDNCRFITNEAKYNDAENSGGRGGAVYLQGDVCDNVVTNCTNTTFSNCIFTGNIAGTNGGAIDWHEGAHDGHVINSTFNNNIAKSNGGAIYWRGHEGEIKDSNFTNNTAQGLHYGSYGNSGDGGAVFWAGINGKVTNVRFIDNRARKNPNSNASGRGGAVYIGSCNHGNKNITISDSYFKDNNAGTNGGAIDWYSGAHDGLVENSIFEHNIANRSGGAIFWNGHNGTIRHSNFTNNHALGITNATSVLGDVTYGGDGGAVMWSGALGDVENCNFINNTAAKRGGAVFLQANNESCENTTFKDSHFEKNTAGTNGGAIDWNKGARNGIVENVTFINNVANRSGGAIFWNGHNGTIKYSNFTNNRALGIANATSVLGDVTYGGDGGAVMWSGALGDVENCNFINNTAAKRGGAVFLQSAATEPCDNTTFKDSHFENNVAGTNGGAIDWNAGAHNGMVDNVTFINNTARRNGGAIFWHGENGTVKNSKFINNRATGTNWQYYFNLDMGDKIVVDTNGNLILGDIIVLQQNHMPLPSDPSVSQYEGKLVVLNYTSPINSKMLRFESYVLTGNASAGYGWKMLDEIDVEISDSMISPVDWAIDQYFGGDGGTILWNGDLGLIDNCTFIDSNSARRGGGAYMTGSDYVTYNDCEFINCTSGTNGGALDWLAGANHGKVINCTFESNKAARSAGTIYYDGNYGQFINITVKNSYAHGGDLKTSPDGSVHYAGWDSSHWDTNTTGGDAGAIMITGDHVYIYNATFINNTAAGRGGAVFLQDNNNVTFELCTFENNQALGIANNTYNNARDTSSGLNKWYTGNGGAIGFDKGASNGTIISSKFINNTAARNGGAVSFSVNSTQAYIFNSAFINNTAKRNGGALEWDGTNGNVSYCNFTGNSAWGTAISKEYADLKSLDDVIAKNGDTVSALGKPSVATDNKLYVLVVSQGGKKVRYELYVSQVADVHYWLKIDETSETSASPVDWAIDEYFGGDGGSIYWSGDNATIDNCKFLDSNSARRGGAAYMTGGDYVSYINCTFENCTSGTNGGGLDWLAGANYGKVIDCNFTNTQAARSAGAIYYDGDYGEFRNIIIRNTTAHGGDLESKNGKVKYAGWDSSHWDTNTTGGDAGAIMLTGDNIKLYNVNITDCTAVGRGGAIFIQDNDNVTIDTCRFENNRALGTANNTYNDPYDTSSGINHELTGHGGAISFDIGASDSSIINSTFINNTAVLYGGAVHFREGASEDKIINSTFEKNHANEDGGALYMDGDDCELHNSTFTSNYAGDDGGAINWKGDVGTIYNITCVNNSGISSHGNSKGGTICLNGNNISLSNSSFTQSYAKVTGGAIFVTGNYVNITGSQFKDCNVTDETGGAIQIVGNYVEVRNSTFEECHAPNGGAIYAEGQHVKIIDSNFTNNNVTKDGAALYVNGDYSQLHNSTFTDNIAGDDGGAIYWQGSHGTIYNITCENNKGINLGDSNSNGGTICITGNDISLTDSSFKNSSAGAQGGAIFVTGDNVNIMTSEFETCNATQEGGAIYVLGDDTTITDCTFEDCNATQGGAIYVEGDRVTISANIKDTHALGEDSYGIVVDYKFYKDNVKEIKYDITDMIEYVATIKLDDVFTNVTISDLNTTLNNLYAAVDNILTTDGINTTNVTKALDIVRQLNATLTQLNASLPAGKDKNIALQLIGDIENIGNELNYLINISKTLDAPDSITAKIDTLIGEIEGITPGGITDADKADLISTLEEIRSDVGNILNGDTFNATNIEHAIKLLKDLNETLKELNATLLNGNDKNDVIKWLGEVKDIENQLNGLCDMVVIPEVVARGGAIYVEGDDATIKDSSINRTDAYEGGAVYVAGDNVMINNTEFNDNTATEDGGALFVDGHNGKLYNSNFTRNTVGDDGGAVSWKGDYGTIYNILCVSNNGTGNGIGGNHSTKGGAIIITGNYATLSKSTFEDSYAGVGGGAIFISGHDVNVTDSVFTHSRAGTKDGSGIGGAIYILGEYCLIDNCTIEDANATQYGGAIYIEGNYTTVVAEFKNNNATLSGGSIYVEGHDALIENSTFKNTHAFGSSGNGGGAIFVHGEHADVVNSNFTDTYANSNSHAKGGAMYITGANAEVLGSIFNNAQSNLQGGAIYVNGTNTTINGSEFYKCNVNSQGSEGGSIYIEGENATIYGSSFIDSAAKYRGGAIFINGENTLIDGSSFVNSSSEFRGGAIYIDGAKAKVKDSNFTDSSVTGGKYNSQNPRGGAIYIKAEDAVVEGSIFNHSTVSNTVGEGGAIYIEGNKTKILGSEFESSSAYTGGAIYLEGNGCNVSDSVFIDSYAYWDGGAMYSTGSNSYVYKSNFTDNLAIHNGGAVYWFGGAASHHNTVDDCIFTNNTAKADPSKDGTNRVTRGGGAIYWSKGGEYGTIKNSEFYYNSVSSTHKVDGGAVLWDASKHALVDTCIFVGNFVTTTGDQVEIPNVVADYKVIWAQGGAMYLRPAQNYTIRNCTFENCSSSKEAGALYIQSDGENGNVLIEDTTFKNNFANATGTNINGGGAVQIKQVYTIDFKMFNS